MSGLDKTPTSPLLPLQSPQLLLFFFMPLRNTWNPMFLLPNYQWMLFKVPTQLLGLNLGCCCMFCSPNTNSWVLIWSSQQEAIPSTLKVDSRARSRWIICSIHTHYFKKIHKFYFEKNSYEMQECVITCNSSVDYLINNIPFVFMSS